MDLNELASGGGPPIDFNGPGSTIEGTLISIGEWRDINGKFGVKVKAPFNLTIHVPSGETDSNRLAHDEDRTLWVPKNSRLATVIGQAFKEAGLTTITTGGLLKIQRVADVPTDKGNDMHDFRAKYTPAAVSAVTVDQLGDEEPF